MIKIDILIKLRGLLIKINYYKINVFYNINWQSSINNVEIKSNFFFVLRNN